MVVGDYSWRTDAMQYKHMLRPIYDEVLGASIIIPQRQCESDAKHDSAARVTKVHCSIAVSAVVLRIYTSIVIRNNTPSTHDNLNNRRQYPNFAKNHCSLIIFQARRWVSVFWRKGPPESGPLGTTHWSNRLGKS